MRVLVYDGSFDGLLTALAVALSHNDEADIVRKSCWQPRMFDDVENVETDQHRAGELANRIRTCGSQRSVQHVLYAHFADVPERERLILRYLRLLMRVGKTVDQHLAEPVVEGIHRISSKVGTEAHRLKGLVRFRSLDSGILWAPIAPDHDVTVLLARHFLARMPRERWVIHDTARAYGALCCDGEVEFVSEQRLPSVRPALGRDEALYAELWRNYFKTIAVHERTNSKLQRQFMPQRYWKYLTELQSG